MVLTSGFAALGGKPDVSSLHFTIDSSVFRQGAFLNEVVSFIIVAAAIFFLAIMPVNAIMALTTKEPPADPTLKKTEHDTPIIGRSST